MGGNVLYFCQMEDKSQSPDLYTCVSGMIGFTPGRELKKEERGEATTTGSGRTKPLRSQLGMVFSSVFSTSVSMA